MEPTHCGEMLREMRLAYGLSQEEMSDCIGVSIETYGRIERGKSTLTIEKFQRYSAVFRRELLKRGLVLEEKFSIEDIVGAMTSMIIKIFQKAS
jgi:transcriptional regulator with XRE-family HTH domain